MLIKSKNGTDSAWYIGDEPPARRMLDLFYGRLRPIGGGAVGIFLVLGIIAMCVGLLALSVRVVVATGTEQATELVSGLVLVWGLVAISAGWLVLQWSVFRPKARQLAMRLLVNDSSVYPDYVHTARPVFCFIDTITHEAVASKNKEYIGAVSQFLRDFSDYDAVLREAYADDMESSFDDFRHDLGRLLASASRIVSQYSSSEAASTVCDELQKQHDSHIKGYTDAIQRKLSAAQAIADRAQANVIDLRNVCSAIDN